MSINSRADEHLKLLGMAFLKRLKSFEVKDNYIYLRGGG